MSDNVALFPDIHPNSGKRDNGGGGNNNGSGNPPGGSEMERRVEKLEATVSDVQVRLIRIESRLESTAERMATKADIHELATTLFKAMNDQTWKFIGVATALAGIAFTAAKFIQ